MLTQVVQSAIRICDGTEYHVPGTCRSCDGVLSGYDSRVKRFVRVLDEDGSHTIEVILRRAYCRACGRIWVPEEPFYPGTRVGSPVVDLCRALATTDSCGQIVARLDQMGIILDRGSVRSYCGSTLPLPPTVVAFGMNIPVSIISLSALAGKTVGEGRPLGDEVLTAIYHPSRTRR
jgi:hypothetical protein